MWGKLWPKVTHIVGARKASRHGFWMAVFCAGVISATAIFSSVAGIFGWEASLWRLVDAALFGIIAFGIYKMSRVAAISGLIVYVRQRIYMWNVDDLRA